ncbi:DUF547 domain-containing protein [Flavobacteriaceae bacterium MHTCC 0001]
MKISCFLIIGLTFISCTGTKKAVTVTETTSTAPKTEILDSVPTSTTEVIKITDALYVPDSKEEIEIIDEPLLKQETHINAFNHQTFDSLLQKHVSKHGNVDYKGIKSNWSALRNYMSELNKNKPKEDWSKNQKLAYWINAYNAMTIDLILRHYPVKSIKDIKNPWKKRYWELSEKWYNLNEIEHQILRKMDEPRIHFVIICASYSCPKLQNRAFTAFNLETQLTKATKEFLSDPERNLISENSLQLSKIFQWFGKDFKQNGSLIDFLNQYSEVQISNKAEINFKDYNWDLNE